MGVIKRIRLYVPDFAVFSFYLALLCAAVHVLSVLNSSFADFFNIYIAGFFRRILSYFTCWFPFSLAEVVIYLLPFAFIAVIIVAIKKSRSSKESLRMISTLLAVVFLIYSAFVLTFACGYQGKTLSEKIKTKNAEVNSEALYRTALWLSQELDKLCPYIDTADTGETVMPYSFSELNGKMLEAYDAVCDKYEFINNFYSRTKEVKSKSAMSYLHILGVYSFFTGEANVNTGPPDYSVPYTVAHEMAHQRGIAREDEANFVAFLACINSSDIYIRYSGYLGVFEYVMSALYHSHIELYRDIAHVYPEKVYKDRLAYSEYYKKYANNPVGDISQKVNDAYLKSQGTQGSISYDMVTSLAVSYYLTNVAE